MESQKRQKAYEYLVNTAKHLGHITFGDIEACADASNLSMPDFDWLTQALAAKEITILDTAERSSFATTIPARRTLTQAKTSDKRPSNQGKNGRRTSMDFTYEIIEEIGVLSENKKGWRKEVNLISWNGNKPKYDIRDWAPDHEKMGKGVTLTTEEFAALKDVLMQLS